MTDILTSLVDAGAWALPALWLPVAVWTCAALLADLALRLTPRGHPLVHLNVRRAMLWALPAGLLAAIVLPASLSPEAIERVTALAPVPLALPTITVGGGAPEAAGVASAAPVPLAQFVAGLALLVAGLVAMVRLGTLARGLWRLRSLTAGTVADETVQRDADAVARLAGVGRSVRAVTTQTPTVPFTFGWRRPVVVVPADLARDPARLRLVLAHEIAHVARGDFASGVAERVAAAVFGWHPLAGALVRGIDLDRERATDAAVLASRPDERRTYADLLLSFSRLPSPALALGAARGSHSLTTRITTMQAPPLSPVRLRRLGRMAQLLALAIFLSAASLAGVASVRPAQASALVAPEAPADASGDIAVTARPAPEAPGALTSAGPIAPLETEAEAVAPEARVIRGNVSDAATGQPLVAANVVVVGTQTGAATDRNGDFVINGVDPGTAQLRITFVGYAPLTVVPQAGEPLRIGLVPQSEGERTRTMREGAEQAQDPARNAGEPQAPEIFEVVERVPELIGGLAGFQQSVVYPPEALEAGTEGKVFVQFVVNEEGGVQDAQTLRCPDELLCQAALTAVRAAQFRPGRQRGKAVKVRFTLPVDFKLAREE